MKLREHLEGWLLPTWFYLVFFVIQSVVTAGMAATSSLDGWTLFAYIVTPFTAGFFGFGLTLRTRMRIWDKRDEAKEESGLPINDAPLPPGLDRSYTIYRDKAVIWFDEQKFTGLFKLADLSVNHLRDGRFTWKLMLVSEVTDDSDRNIFPEEKGKAYQMRIKDFEDSICPAYTGRVEFLEKHDAGERHCVWKYAGDGPLTVETNEERKEQ